MYVVASKAPNIEHLEIHQFVPAQVRSYIISNEELLTQIEQDQPFPFNPSSFVGDHWFFIPVQVYPEELVIIPTSAPMLNYER